MAYSFSGVGVTFFAAVTRKFGGDYYHISEALEQFASNCNATLIENAVLPTNVSVVGSLVCNTNTGDIATEAGLSLNFLADTASALLDCVIGQANAFQGNDYCNESQSGLSNTLTLGIIAGVVALGCCVGLIKKANDRSRERFDTPIPSSSASTVSTDPYFSL
jgi:hypothetical protein